MFLNNNKGIIVKYFKGDNNALSILKNKIEAKLEVVTKKDEEKE
jgi:hypothetical protein